MKDSYPAVTAENVKIDVVGKTWLGDRQLLIDTYGRTWITGTYGLELHDGNVQPPVPAEAPANASEPTSEVEVTEVNEADIQPQDNLVEVTDAEGNADLVPAELLEDAVDDSASDTPFNSGVVEPLPLVDGIEEITGEDVDEDEGVTFENVDDRSEAELAADVAEVEAFAAAQESGDEAVIPAEPESPVADA